LPRNGPAQRDATDFISERRIRLRGGRNEVDLSGNISEVVPVVGLA
jgi:hypothetical protein